MTHPGVNNLFVYGSFQNGFCSPVYKYISCFFKFVIEGKVRGKLFDLGSCPAGIPANDNTFITGELYKAKGKTEFSRVIGKPVDYKRMNVEPDEMHLFSRELAEIFYNNSITYTWIYWYNGDVNGKQLIASGDLK